MAAVTVLSDFGTQENKVCHCFHFFPIYLPWSDATWCSVGFWSKIARASMLLKSLSRSIMSEFTIPETAACQASLSITISQSLLKLMSTESLMPPNHLSAVTLFSSCLQSFPASGSFLMSLLLTSNESAPHITWPKYWSFSFSISSSNEYSGLIYFRIDWFDLLAVRGTLESLRQHHSSKASILQCSGLFMVQLLHLHMTTGKTIALTRWTFVS